MGRLDNKLAIRIRNEEALDNYLSANLDDIAEAFDHDKYVDEDIIVDILKERAKARRITAKAMGAGELLIGDILDNVEFK